MTAPINVDEARKALARVERASYSRAPPYFQSPDFATISAALDRLEELEANPQGVYIPEARETLNKLIRNKSVSLEEASFLSTAINRAEEVPALSMERDAAIRQARLADGHAKRMTESVVCVEAERDALKAWMKEWQAQCVENLQALGAATQNNGVLRAKLEAALANQKVKGFTTSDNAYSQALDREFSLFCKLKTAKGLLRKASKYLSRVADSLPYSDTLAELGEDIPAFLNSKEDEE